MNYILHIVILFEIYIILSLSLNLMLGFTGLLSLAHAAFYGIGAYTTTLLMMKLGWNFLPALIGAVALSSVLSLVISYCAVRFKGDYFILTTLGFQSIVFAILYNWVSVTEGPYGIPGIPHPSFFGFTISSINEFAVFGAVFCGLISLLLYRLKHSPFGTTLKAIRDDELAAQTLGKNTMLFKIKSTTVASAIAAVAGSLYATYVTYIDLTTFTLDESMLLAAMVLIGGTGNVRGPVLGALIIILIPELLRFLEIPSSAAPNIRMIIFGALLIFLMYKRPRGLLGDYDYE